MRHIFIGPARFWAIWIGVLAVLWLAGRAQLHVTSFAWFLALVAGLAAVSVLAVIRSARAGERITREPIEDAD